MTDTDLGRWQYSGDTDMEYGGVFIDLSTYDEGYCDAVRVTDLDGGCGFKTASLIEHVVINGTTDAHRVHEALRSCDGDLNVGEYGLFGHLWPDVDMPMRQLLCQEPWNLEAWGVASDRLKEHGDEQGAEFLEGVAEHVRYRIAEALCSYGYVDPDDAWDNYQRGHSEVVQCEPDGPMQFDGWKANKRLHNTTLEAYVKSQHLEI